MIGTITAAHIDVSVLVPAKDEAENLPLFMELCEAAFRDDADPAPLNAAHAFIDMLEDALKESEALATALEARVNSNLKLGKYAR